MKPIIKYPGGKTQLLPEIYSRLPPKLQDISYYEPFLGGGSVALRLMSGIITKDFVISDVNPELMMMYRVVKDNPQELIDILNQHPNDPNHYIEVREWDRDPNAFAQYSDIERAARLIYLNRTCYNGLFRVNSKGQFNMAFGSYSNPTICDSQTILDVSTFLNRSGVTLSCGDFQMVLKGIRNPAMTFAYLDPPYDETYTSYTSGGFGKQDQRRLKDVCDDLNSKGVKFMLSNSKTDYILNLYSSYQIDTIKAKRSINRNSAGRGSVDEVIIRNY